MNIVSDETFMPILLRFYNMTGPEWSSESCSHHVDWSRASNDGSPGLYTRAGLEAAPRLVAQVLFWAKIDFFCGKKRFFKII